MPLKKINLNGISFEYSDVGEGAAIVFLHGLGGGVCQSESTVEPPEGFRMIVPNQQGHGGSGVDWQKFCFDRLGDDMVALLDALNIPNAYFAGISMGAAVSLNIALRYPKRVRKLLLIRNAWIDTPMSEEVQRVYRDMGNCLRSGGLEAFRATRGWRVVQSLRSAYTANAFTAPFSDDVSLRCWRKYLLLPPQSPIPNLPLLGKIDIPTMILANRDDFCHPFAYGEILSRHIPGSEFSEIPSKDADPAEHKKRINQALRRLL